MGFIRRLFEPREQRALSDAQLIRVLSGGGGSVTPGSAMQIATVFACARVLAEGVAMLPLELRARETRGSRAAIEHPLFVLLKELPNPEMTSAELRETMMGHLAGWGNAFAQKVPDAAGRWLELWPLRPDRTAPKRADDGRLVYEHQDGQGRTRTLEAWEVMHIRGLSPDGLMGYSPIAVARRTFERKAAMEEAETAFYRNGAAPGVVLTHPGKLQDKAFERLRSSWEARHQGPQNVNRPAILEEGMDIKSIGIPQADAQFLESEKFTSNQIAALFKVPSHMINDLERATFANIEQMSLEFVTYTLMPWLIKWEQAIARDLLGVDERKRYFAKHKVQGLLRGDNASRAQYYAAGLQWGYMSINDVRELEDLNPVANGDTYFVPLNMVPIGQAVQGPVIEQTPVRAVTEHVGEHRPLSCTCSACERERQAAGEQRAEDEGEDADEQLRGSRVEMALAMRPVLEDVARRVTRREVQDVRRALGKEMRKRGRDEFMAWLSEFYQNFDGVVEENFRAALLSYARSAMLAAAAELGKKSKGLTDALRAFVEEYLAVMGDEWAGSSRRQLEALLTEAEAAGADPVELIEERLAGWEETKPGKAADQHAFEALNAFVIAAYGAYQVRTIVWLASGESCPFCRSLSGKRAGIEEYFVAGGSSLDAGTGEPMLVRRNVRHGPLHGGCDCVVRAA